MKNVIDLTARLKQQGKSRKETAATTAAPIVDMVEKRQEILQKERREVKRTILSEFVGAFVVIPERGLVRVNLYDISANGCAFDIETTKGHFSLGEEIAMRVYLNQFTYFPFVVKMANIRSLGDEGVFRHGGEFVKDTINEEALYHFVRFIETVSASLKKDAGDVMVSNLTTR